MSVSGGTAAYHTWAHMNKVIQEKGFDVSLHDVTEQIGILSVQGPNRYCIVSYMLTLLRFILRLIKMLQIIV